MKDTKYNVGHQKSQKGISSSLVWGGNSGESFITKFGNVNISKSYTQDKVDVKVEMFDNNQINASVKNVNLSNNRNVNIHSGTSILKFLQMYPEFANHYLNVTAVNNASRNRPAQLLQEAHNTLKYTLALHALAGGMIGKNKSGQVGTSELSELFVVNDSSKGRFKVYFISDIINNLENKLDLLDAGDLNNLKIYKNEFVRDEAKRPYQNAFARISKILQEVHTEQIKLSINPKVLV